MSFLKAEWRKLAFANYIIEPQILNKYLPFGTELDLWNDKCFVSLVGFKFVNVKLLGIKIPYHTDFEEANLRFYVKRKEGDIERRGVVFIKEIVPKSAITYVANTIYRENYETMPMAHNWIVEDENRVVEYRWKKQNKWHSFKIEAMVDESIIPENSQAEFITEHYWGYAKVKECLTNEYEVRHPKWNQYKVTGFNIDVDFGSIYGAEFKGLNNIEPDSVFLAEGSNITVESKRKIFKP